MKIWYKIWLLISMSCIVMAMDNIEYIKYKETKMAFDAHTALWLDSRSQEQYMDGTIMGALSFPQGRYNRLKRFLPIKKNAKIIIFDQDRDGIDAEKLANKIATLNYTNIKIYIDGYDGWVARGATIMAKVARDRAHYIPKQEATLISGTKVYLGSEEGSIDARWFTTAYRSGQLNGVELIDVRPLVMYKRGHLKGAKHIEWNSDTNSIDSSKLDKEKLTILYCNTGMRSSDAYDSLDENISKSVLYLDARVRCHGDKCNIK